MSEIIIRAYQPQDREAVRRLYCETAFMGRPVEIFFEGREILADLMTLYYTDYEPESLFVAEFEGKVVGYLTGCKDTAKKYAVFNKKIFLKTFWKFMRSGLMFNEKNLKFFGSSLKSLLKGQFFPPKIPKTYPAHLHINVEESFRRSGAGEKLMNAYFDYLRKSHVPGIHLSTFSNLGRNFFAKMGFVLLWEGKTSQFRHIVHEDIKVSTFGKVLEGATDFPGTKET